MKKFLFLQVVIICLAFSSVSAFAAAGDASNTAAVYLMDESNEVMYDADSYSMLMDMLIEIGVEAGGETEQIEVGMAVDAVVDMTDGVYAKYLVTESLTGESVEMEVTMTANGMYAKYPGSQGWESLEEFFDITSIFPLNQYMDSEEEFSETMEIMNGKLVYNQNAVIDGQDYYVITCDLTVEDFIALYEAAMDEVGLEELGVSQEDLDVIMGVLSGLEGDCTMYTYISKDSMLQEYFRAEVDASYYMEIEGEALNFDFDFVLDAQVEDINTAVLPELDLSNQ